MRVAIGVLLAIGVGLVLTPLHEDVAVALAQSLATGTPTTAHTGTPTAPAPAQPAPTAQPTATIVAAIAVVPINTPVPTATRTPTRTPTQTPTATPTPTKTPTAAPAVASLAPVAATPRPTPGVTARGVVLSNVATSSITRSGATVTWTTDLPSTSWVEFGPTPAYGTQTPADPSLLTTHSVVLDGLQPGTTYHVRAASASASGLPAVSVDGTFTTAPAGTGPDVLDVGVRRVTSTNALIGWTTPTGNFAQLEYGTSINYGSFTLLQVFSTQAQEMVLSNLTPGTQYHLRVKEWDGAGYLAASPDLIFVTTSAGPATLIGNQTVQPAPVIIPQGRAAAYQYVASQSGLASRIRVYVDDGSTSGQLRAALYSDQAGAPGAILAQGSIVPAAGWNTIALPPTFVLGGGRYWLAVLSPSGALATRQASASGTSADGTSAGGSSQLSLQGTLAAFPAAWTPGAAGASAPLAAYVQQIPPSVTVMAPNDGATLNGPVELSAVVDDDSPVTLVQFLVDGVPVGVATRAPFTLTWDSSAARTRTPHTIAARAMDALGRTATSAVVTVASSDYTFTTPSGSTEPAPF